MWTLRSWNDFVIKYCGVQIHAKYVYCVAKYIVHPSDVCVYP